MTRATWYSIYLLQGIPASVQIFDCGKDLQSQPIAWQSFFRCYTVQMSWNNGSTGLLIVVQADVDKTNQSYYGESKLNYMTTDGSHDGLVPLRKEGPVHDLQWSSTGKEFAVVYGCILIHRYSLEDLLSSLKIHRYTSSCMNHIISMDDGSLSLSSTVKSLLLPNIVIN
ncbi:translation initiation factor [Lithospermum erythrorhizon]|uniref:Translation initiation factor n=1 Tax=Lithospermum erythrorhizon TaxID=34254 RepID=A0AAV3PUA8_LITER